MRRKIWSWAFTVIWCSVIFFMSSRNGDQSSGMSQVVTQILNHLISTISGSHAFVIPEIVVRKLAHLTEYFLLGILLCSGFFSPLYPRRSLAIAFITGSLYAASDEFHQVFIPGRTAELHDIGIDSFGVLCGTIVMLWVLAKRKKEVGQV